MGMRDRLSVLCFQYAHTTFFRFLLKVVAAVNVLVSYTVKLFISKHARVPAVESKRVKSTLLVISIKAFCLRKTFLTAGGYRSEVNHVPLSYW